MSRLLSGGKIVFIVGANASGKSALSLALAKTFNGEIVSADSRQVYRGLDIGSGKLTAAERGDVKHHLIDVEDPTRVFTLFDFQQRARAAIHEISGRRRLPIVAGGTGLYIDSIADGYQLVDVPASEELRRSLSSRTREELIDLVRVEQPAAVPHLVNFDSRRLIRAIEIIRAGVEYKNTRTKHALPDRCMIGVYWTRDLLEERVMRRLKLRMTEGMVEEVVELRRNGVSDQFLFDLGLEYRFILKRLIGEIETDEKLVELLGRAIMQFAKRQMTWFRRHKDITWIEGGSSAPVSATELVEAYLAGESKTRDCETPICLPSDPQ